MFAVFTKAICLCVKFFVKACKSKQSNWTKLKKHEVLTNDEQA